MIDEVIAFLEGRSDDVIRRVRTRMEEAAEALEFERAAMLRDQLFELKNALKPGSGRAPGNRTQRKVR